MKTFLRLIFAALLFLPAAACSDDESVTFRHDISGDEIVLGGETDAAESFTLTASDGWEIACTGSGFAVSPLEGGAGATVVSIRATGDNPDYARRTLGSLSIRLIRNGTELTLRVLQRPARAPQTVLLYLPGQELLSYYKRNLDDLRASLSPDTPGDCRILACYQPSSHERIELEEIYYDAASRQGASRPLTSLDGFTASSSESVARLFALAGQYAPAYRYGLIVGCHGKAWVPASEGQIINKIGMGGPAPESDFDEQLLWQPVPGVYPTRSFGDPDYEIDIAAFAEAIRSLDYRFDYAIFDACFMASIETLYDLRDIFDRIVASPCEIMATGFPYRRLLPPLLDPAGADLQRVCEVFYQLYQYDYASIGSLQSGCISLCVTSQLEPLAQIVRQLHALPTQPFDLAALQSYEGMSTHLFFDLGHYIASAYDDPVLTAEFAAQLDRAFPPASRLHTETFFSVYNGLHNPVLDAAYTGVSTSEPSPRYRPVYPSTAWYRTTH